MELKVSQSLPFALGVIALDKFGNPVGDVQPLDGPASVNLSDPAKGSINMDPSGLLGSFIPNGALGAEQIQASGAYQGNPVSGSLDLDLIAGDPVSFGIQIAPGTPVNMP